MPSLFTGCFVQTRSGKMLPSLMLLLSITLISACGDASSGSDTDGPAPVQSNPVTITSGDRSVTVSNASAGSGRSSAQESACIYNVYIASEQGVTKENYSDLPNGGIHENITFPYTISDLANGTTYYLVVYEVCDGVAKQVGKEVSATPSSPADDQVIPESVDVISAEAGVESVLIGWKSPADFSVKTSNEYPTINYIVCFQEGPIGDAATCVTDIWRGKSSHTFTGLTGGVEYCFGVKQNKEQIGMSLFGATICQTPLPLVQETLAASYEGATGAVACGNTVVDNGPDDLDLAIGFIGLKLVWTDLLDETGYRIQIDANSMTVVNEDDSAEVAANIVENMFTCQPAISPIAARVRGHISGGTGVLADDIVSNDCYFICTF